MPFPKLNRGPSQARHARADFYDLQVFISPPGLALRATSKTCHCAQQSYRPRLEVAAATSSGAVLQAEEERAEGPHYTRITETPAKCPFAGTKSFSTKETDYQSWKEGPFDLKTGLHPLEDAEDLYEIDEHYVEEMEERRQLLDRMHTEVFASTSEATEANKELLETMSEILPQKYPDRFKKEGNTIHNLALKESYDLDDPDIDPLKIATLLVQEDLAIMQIDPKSKQYKLTAAAILFPMRWSLAQKMNKRLNVIHGPVPFYQQNLRRPVDDFMADLTPEQPSWRANYAITDIPYLFQALTEMDMFNAKKDKLESVKRGHITMEDAPDKLYVRCERQTLSRLPKSGAILFTIRTYVRPLREYLEKDKAALRRLYSAVQHLPEVWVNYKLMQGCKDIALELMSRHLEEDA